MSECEINGSDACREAALVLVVDDQPANIQAVGAHLSAAGFDVMPAISGAQALQRLSVKMPDLILLDLLMPEMDGFQVLQELKRRPEFAALPVIVLTAIQDREQLMRAFSAGAVDYLTKPFVVAELLARVRTHVELKRARDHLARIAKEQSELTQIVAHDLKNPLSSIQFSTQMLQQKRELAPERRTRLLENIHESTSEALNFIKSYLGRWADGEIKRHHQAGPLDLSALLIRHTERLADAAAARGMNISVEIDPEILPVMADQTAASNALQNLLSNAIRYGNADSNIDVQLCAGTPGFVRLRILDRGPGISAEDQKKLFRRYARLGTAGSSASAINSSGLGLAIAKQEITQMGGQLWYEDRPGGGAIFAFELPITGQSEENTALAAAVNR